MVGKILQAVFGLLLLGSPVAALADEADAQVLVLKFSDAKTANFYLADQPVITFDDGKFVVTSGTAVAEYAQADVTEYYFASVPTAVQDHAVGTFSFKYNDNAHVYVSGTKAAKAALYDVSGKLVSTAAVTDGSVTVSLEGCAPGVYVLSLENDHSFKIIKK